MASDSKDRLTGLLTDQYLRDDLDGEFKRAARFGREIAFVLFEAVIPADVKADMVYTVLKVLARVCEGSVRQIDDGVRWGHQVLLILPETGREGAEKVATKIEAAFAEKKFQHPQTAQDIPVGLKTAIQIFPGDSDDKDAILGNLREALLGGETAPAS